MAACAELLERAVWNVLVEGKVLTPDLGGNASTSEMGRAIAERIASG